MVGFSRAFAVGFFIAFPLPTMAVRRVTPVTARRVEDL